MSMTALHGNVVATRPLSFVRVSASSRRLGWISVILGLISIDLDILALFSVIAPPARWYADLLLSYGPSTVLPIAMLALGGPLAIAGLYCAGATLSRGRAPVATLLGVALCAVSLAIPVCFAASVYIYWRGLL